MSVIRFPNGIKKKNRVKTLRWFKMFGFFFLAEKIDIATFKKRATARNFNSYPACCYKSYTIYYVKRHI